MTARRPAQHLLRSTLTISMGLIAACDGKDTVEAEKQLEAKARHESEAQEKAAAKRKADREAKVAQEAAADKAKQEAIERLTVVPDKLPKKLGKACKQLVLAYDEYMRSVLTGDLKTKWETGGNEMQLGIQLVECKKRSIEVAACQTQALGKMTADQEKDMGAIFTRCVQKFQGGR